MQKEKPYKILKPPKGLERYILMHADKGYLITDNKTRIGTCSCCGRPQKIYGLKHNDTACCAHCNRTVIVKESRYGRKKLEERGRILYLKKYSATTYAELLHYTIDYTTTIPTVLYAESDVYKLNKEVQERYEYVRLYVNGTWQWCWEKARTVKITDVFRGFGWKGHYIKTIFYNPSISETGTDLRYADFSICMDELGQYPPDYVIGYINNFLKYPSIEILQKSGFLHIVKQKSFYNVGSRAINWRGRNLKKILKLDAGELTEFRKINMGEIYTLEEYKKIKKIFLMLSFKYIHLFRWDSINKNQIEEIIKYMTIETLYKYVCKNKIPITDYQDYFSDLQKLQLNLANRRILRPKDFVKAHAERAKQVVALQNEITLKKFLENDIAAGLEYNDNKYLIRPAASPEELQKEGDVLGHCVGTYINKMADKRCAILFVRLSAEPNNPLYTIELSPDYKIKQFRGRYNSTPPEDAKKFVSDWTEWLAKTKRIKKGA
ncbi:PcfJ-like protein [Peptostreptococcaceae bacterium pGA-8]|nr:PcfJ-like protein [Peptostreptococcaceae bacterium pGA-8]